MGKPTEVLKGTLDLMILKALSWGPMHGYGVVEWLKDTTGAVLQVEDGAMYPALHRLQRKGWISGSWGITENNRRAKYYELTEAGRLHLDEELDTWSRFSDAVWSVVHATERPS